MRVYGVELDSGFDPITLKGITDNMIIARGEKNGQVYTLGGFITALNNDWVDTENYYFKNIKI